jgi:hypothetical protein
VGRGADHNKRVHAGTHLSGDGEAAATRRVLDSHEYLAPKDPQVSRERRSAALLKAARARGLCVCRRSDTSFVLHAIHRPAAAGPSQPRCTSQLHVDAHDGHHASLEVGRWHLFSRRRGQEEETAGSCCVHNVGRVRDRGVKGCAENKGGGPAASTEPAVLHTAGCTTASCLAGAPHHI